MRPYPGRGSGRVRAGQWGCKGGGSHMADAISILLVDDHPVVRQGLRSMLETDVHLNIVAEAENGEDALRKVDECSPQVVLIDIHMPVMDGLTATRRIKDKFPHTSVIVLTLYNNEQYVIEAVKAGAGGGLFLKTHPRRENPPHLGGGQGG